MNLFFLNGWNKALDVFARVGWKRALSITGGVGLIALITMGLRPIQKDSAHVVGFFNSVGGRVLHPAEFAIDKEFAGDYTITITGQAAEPVRGDLRVQMVGAQPVDYLVSTRNPPAVPLINKGHAWYRFEKDTFYDVQPGDNLIVYIKVHAPVPMGEYSVVFYDPPTGRIFLNVPVTFTDPNAVLPAGEDCH
jgi:hypothetical protein